MIVDVCEVLGGVQVNVVSDLSGKASVVELFGYTLDEVIRRLENNQKIQDAFPRLSVDDRELLMTGITAEEWDENFGSED